VSVWFRQPPLSPSSSPGPRLSISLAGRRRRPAPTKNVPISSATCGRRSDNTCMGAGRKEMLSGRSRDLLASKACAADSTGTEVRPVLQPGVAGAPTSADDAACGP
jgi:hypothetical protein